MSDSGESVSIHEPSLNVVIGSWKEKAAWVRRTKSGSVALVALQNGTKVLICVGDGSKRSAWIQMWAGEPHQSNGVALLGDGDTPSKWADIPLCDCGVRECGNANRQFGENLEAHSAAELLSELTSLKHAGPLDKRQDTWHLRVPLGSEVATREAESNSRVADEYWQSATGAVVTQHLDRAPIQIGEANGVVRFWRGGKGWGVLDSDATPGGCWAHFSNVKAEGYRSLKRGERVWFTWETGRQDGYDFRAITVVAK